MKTSLTLSAGVDFGRLKKRTADFWWDSRLLQPCHKAGQYLPFIGLRFPRAESSKTEYLTLHSPTGSAIEQHHPSRWTQKGLHSIFRPVRGPISSRWNHIAVQESMNSSLRR